MKAYKFRSSAQIAYALDIILNRRLHCSDWHRLNDPMEGMFVYSTHGPEPEAQRRVKGIGEAKRQYKVCSLAGAFQSHLLWSHYAGGFDGLAIEIDLPDDDYRVRKVEYRGVFAFLDMDRVRDETEAAQRILYSKYRDWEYEQEVRILNETEWYGFERPVSRVIAGTRMPLALSETLSIVCERQNIQLCEVGIGDEGIDADAVFPMDLEVRCRRERRHLG